MARYEHLPIYKAALDLTVHAFRVAMRHRHRGRAGEQLDHRALVIRSRIEHAVRLSL